jgi:hypothetical protein
MMGLPIAGYMGHVPGLVAHNQHGGVWRDLVLQEIAFPGAQGLSTLHRGPRVHYLNDDLQQSLSEMSSPLRSLRPASARPEPAKGPQAIMRLRPRSATVANLQENSFMPRQDKRWSPPVAGYSGFVPGVASGNLHGSPWKVTRIISCILTVMSRLSFPMLRAAIQNILNSKCSHTGAAFPFA